MGGEAADRRALINQILRIDRDVCDEFVKRMRAPGLFELDLTMGQLKVLMYLSVAEAANMGDLAQTMGVALPSVTPLVDRLVERGLVARRGDPDDRRVVVVVITDEGRELAEGFHDTGREQLEGVLDRLSDDELRLVDEAMKLILRGAQEVAAAQPEMAPGPAVAGAARRS